MAETPKVKVPKGKILYLGHNQSIDTCPEKFLYTGQTFAEKSHKYFVGYFSSYLDTAEGYALREDIDGLRENEAIVPKAIDMSIAILNELNGEAAATARLSPSIDGCSIAWPHLGVFCEVDSDAIEIHLCPVDGIRTKLQIQKYPDVLTAAKRLNGEVNTN